MKNPFASLLPTDPNKRDMTILALLVVPLIILGVIWGTVYDFSEDRPPATEAPGYHPGTPALTATPQSSASPLFVIVA